MPVEWVSVNNRAKSKKQEQETIELTDDSERRLESKGREIKEDDSKPPQAVTQKRPEEQPEDETASTTADTKKPAKPNRNNAQIETNRRINAQD